MLFFAPAFAADGALHVRVDVTDGPLAGVDLSPTLAQDRPALVACRAAADKPGLNTLTLTVGPDGRVRGVDDREFASSDKELLKCVARAMEGSRFPAASGKSRVRYGTSWNPGPPDTPAPAQLRGAILALREVVELDGKTGSARLRMEPAGSQPVTIDGADAIPEAFTVRPATGAFPVQLTGPTELLVTRSPASKDSQAIVRVRVGTQAFSVRIFAADGCPAGGAAVSWDTVTGAVAARGEASAGTCAAKQVERERGWAKLDTPPPGLNLDVRATGLAPAAREAIEAELAPAMGACWAGRPGPARVEIDVATDPAGFALGTMVAYASAGDPPVACLGSALGGARFVPPASKKDAALSLVLTWGG
jgi:hypothetical protein